MTGEAPAAEEPKPEGPKWAFKTRFPIQDRMEEIIHLTIDAAEKESARLRRKLERMRLGS